MPDIGTERVLAVISGMSSAGKTVVLNTPEDRGDYCIDTLPVKLFGNLVDTLTSDSDFSARVAINMATRNAPQAWPPCQRFFVT